MICVVTMSGSNDPPSLLHFCCSSLFGHLENTKKSPFLHNFESFKLCGRKILFVFLLLLFLLYLKYVHGLIQHTLHVFFFKGGSLYGIQKFQIDFRLIRSSQLVVGLAFLLVLERIQVSPSLKTLISNICRVQGKLIFRILA